LEIKEILDTQQQLQIKMGDPCGQGESGVKENILALIAEAVETLEETNWKPWKKDKKPVDRARLLGEMTDILQFWANMVLAAGFDNEDVEQSLRAKWEINHKRIDDGY